MMGKDKHIEELEQTLHRAGGWVVTCSENKTARIDLKVIDDVLNRKE